MTVSNNLSFIVKNITSSPTKTIKIFNYPILAGQVRDLMQIPGIGEHDIRASLLKGEVLNKFLVGDITLVSSNIDLLQFSEDQRSFFSQLGIITGMQVGTPQIEVEVVSYIQTEVINTNGGVFGITTGQHESLHSVAHFLPDGPGSGFASGAYKISYPSGSIFPSSIIWYADQTLTQKIIEKRIIWNGVAPISITYIIYDIDGISIVKTVNDSIVYQSNIFEVARVRTII